MPEISHHFVVDGKANGGDAEIFLDDSANAEYVKRSYTREHKIRTSAIPPIQLGLADGSKSGSMIGEVCMVNTNIGGHAEQIRCFVTDDLEYDMVLGFGWHSKHEPQKSWRHQTLTFSDEGCKKHSWTKDHKTVSVPMKVAQPLSTRLPRKDTPIKPTAQPPRDEEAPQVDISGQSPPPPVSVSAELVQGPPPKIEEISVAALRRMSR